MLWSKECVLRHSPVSPLEKWGFHANTKYHSTTFYGLTTHKMADYALTTNL